MSHVITQSCCSDAGCVSVCPVNCIHPTPDERGFGSSDILHIDPVACIDCGACADACPVDAIFPADRLGERDRVFIEVNASYYRDNPDVSSGWSDIVYPDIPRLPDKLCVAVVGTGPAGGYAVSTLVGRTDVDVTVIDRLPTPGGLVRAGVAPDHPGTKGVLRTFDLLYRHRRVHLLGGVEIGAGPAAVAPAELVEHFDAVFYAVGAGDARALGVPGEELPGSISATDLVAWYNAYPGADGPPIPDGGAGRALIVGTGNVALDVARIMVSSPESLATTDIADRALDLLRRQDVREVVLLGRRDQANAAYTAAEFRALQELPDVEVVITGSADGLGLDAPADPARRRIVFLFHSSIREIVDGPHGAVGGARVTTDGSDHRVAADLVVRSIGYRGVPIPGVPFDDDRGVIPTDDGRVLGESGEPVPGVYALGWAARGAVGGIGANKAHAVSTVEAFIDDAAAGRLPRTVRAAAEFRALAENRSPTLVRYRGVRAIDRAERDRGRAVGRPRVKFTELSDMLAVARRRS
ncbi:putative ferredoxin/ferredoxin--NADP reductase [Gordonia spumicola]|uniref:ferredoxin--NADP(+) reductase n=1 Tax=Gordonia spumicola TaxID=589161 RepID=A0A7I9V6J9_9ACTN|nr:FAD-dependent oxidoreductase [Gordonia spumicola]GEE00995.1 putative ferredoxin/ferredoxin--NADP reductase [Gordonia spumicola]